MTKIDFFIESIISVILISVIFICTSNIKKTPDSGYDNLVQELEKHPESIKSVDMDHVMFLYKNKKIYINTHSMALTIVKGGNYYDFNKITPSKYCRKEFVNFVNDYRSKCNRIACLINAS